MLDNPTRRVAVVDDDRSLTMLVERYLTTSGVQVCAFDSAEALLASLDESAPEVVCLDIGLPGLSGLDTLDRLRAKRPDVPVVMLTSDAQIDRVVDAMRRGAFDYVTKPIDRTKLVHTVQHALEKALALRPADTGVIDALPPDAKGYAGIVGRSSKMRALFRQLERLAPSDIPVLIHGESGTGKELAANALHRGSPRASAPFVAVNCAAIPESLQDSELFGHERGAFTGALQARAGRFEQAHRGTLFLDEIGELSLSLQAKLLRVLQEQEFERIGGTRTIRSDFRLLAATHRDLRAMVRAGQFREDLFFRIAVFELTLPPLRERGDDLVLLVTDLLGSIANGGAQPVPSAEALTLLGNYRWPGNIRELQNVLRRACLVSDGRTIRPADLPPHISGIHSVAPPPMTTDRAREEPSPASPATTARLPAEPVSAEFQGTNVNLEDLERSAILAAMQETDKNVSEVARRLGVARTTLYRKLRRYGIPW